MSGETGEKWDFAIHYSKPFLELALDIFGIVIIK